MPCLGLGAAEAVYMKRSEMKAVEAEPDQGEASEMAEHPKGRATSWGAAARKGLEGLGAKCNGAPKRSGAPESPTAGGIQDTTTLLTHCHCRRGMRPEYNYSK